MPRCKPQPPAAPGGVTPLPAAAAACTPTALQSAEDAPSGIIGGCKAPASAAGECCSCTAVGPAPFLSPHSISAAPSGPAAASLALAAVPAAGDAAAADTAPPGAVAARRRHCAALLRRARPGRGARRRARRRHRRRRQWVAARGKLLGREHCEGGELDDSAPRQLAAQRLLQVDAPVLRLVRLLHKNMICSLKLIGFKNCSSRRGFSTTAQGAAKGRHAAGGTHGHGSSLRTALLHAQTVPTAPCSRW